MSAMRCDGSIVRRSVQVEENVCWALRRIWEPQKQGQLERTRRRDIEDEGSERPKQRPSRSRRRKKPDARGASDDDQAKDDLRASLVRSEFAGCPCGRDR